MVFELQIVDVDEDSGIGGCSVRKILLYGIEVLVSCL